MTEPTTDLFTALRVLVHTGHLVMIASGRGKLLVLKPDRELDVVDDPRAGYDATTYPSQALVREGETLVVEHAPVRPREHEVLMGSNAVLVSYSTRSEPLDVEDFHAVHVWLAEACREIGVHLDLRRREG